MSPSQNRIIIRSVCELYHISPAMLRTKTKVRTVTVPRGVAVYLLHNAGNSMRQVGRMLGIVPASVHQMYHETKDAYTVDADFRGRVELIEAYARAATG